MVNGATACEWAPRSSTTPARASEFSAELVSQLFHAGVFITEQAQRIEVLEADWNGCEHSWP